MQEGLGEIKKFLLSRSLFRSTGQGLPRHQPARTGEGCHEGIVVEERLACEQDALPSPISLESLVDNDGRLSL